MDRREFLKQIALWSAGAAVASPLFTISQDVFAGEKAVSKLVVGKGLNYAELVSKVLSPLGGMEAFVKKGMKVVIKPNIGWDRRVEQAANTHPEVVKELVLQALKAGAERVMIFDRTCNEERRCYNNSGIKPILKEIDDKRVECVHIDERKFIPVKIKKGKSIEEWSFYKDALVADCYINVPIAKHHGLSKLSLGMKNIMGVIGGKRGIIHKNMGQNLADLNTVIKPTLTMVDATRILLRNGPQGGSVNDVKQMDTLIASTDLILADAYATTLFGLNPSDIDSTVAGFKMGLGEMDITKAKIINV